MLGILAAVPSAKEGWTPHVRLPSALGGPPERLQCKQRRLDRLQGSKSGSARERGKTVAQLHHLLASPLRNSLPTYQSPSHMPDVVEWYMDALSSRLIACRAHFPRLPGFALRVGIKCKCTRYRYCWFFINHGDRNTTLHLRAKVPSTPLITCIFARSRNTSSRGKGGGGVEARALRTPTVFVPTPFSFGLMGQAQEYRPRL